jgi:hypothetical protein
MSACLTILLALGACDDKSYREIGSAINVLTKKSEELPDSAIARLKKIGRRAIPQIETAMHTASSRGKVNLISALEAIGEPESAAILQHFAVYDKHREVRSACEDLLGKWSTAGGPLGSAAKLALSRVQEKRHLVQED